MFEELYEDFDYKRALGERQINKERVDEVLALEERRVQIGKYEHDLANFFLMDLISKSHFEQTLDAAPYLNDAPFKTDPPVFEYEVSLIPGVGPAMMQKYIELAGQQGDTHDSFWLSFLDHYDITVVTVPPESSFEPTSLLCFGYEGMDHQLLGVIAADSVMNLPSDLRRIFDYGLAKPMSGRVSGDKMFISLDSITLAGIDIEHENPYRSLNSHEHILEVLEDFHNSHWIDYEKQLRPRSWGDEKSPATQIPKHLLEPLREYLESDEDTFSFSEEENSYLCPMGYRLHLAELEDKVYAYMPGVLGEPIGPFLGEGGELLLKNLRDLPGSAIAKPTSYEIYLYPEDARLVVYSGRKSPRKIQGPERVY